MPPSALDHRSALDASATPVTRHRATADGAHPYRRDLPDVEFHLLDTGHFALEDKADEMVPLIRNFLDRKVARK
jgi:pimeloyl-ACP methyl ester carboxylesterase